MVSLAKGSPSFNDADYRNWRAYLGQEFGESQIDVGGVQGRGLDEHESVLLGKALGLFSMDGTQVAEIGLVTDKHDNDVGVCMLAHLRQPPRYRLVGAVLGDIVQQQGADSTTVVGRRDGSVTLLSS